MLDFGQNQKVLCLLDLVMVHFNHCYIRTQCITVLTGKSDSSYSWLLSHASLLHFQRLTNVCELGKAPPPLFSYSVSTLQNNSFRTNNSISKEEKGILLCCSFFTNFFCQKKNSNSLIRHIATFLLHLAHYTNKKGQKSFLASFGTHY